jgi:hypothetical protein
MVFGDLTKPSEKLDESVGKCSIYAADIPRFMPENGPVPLSKKSSRITA